MKVFKRCLAKFDTEKMNFEPILATTENRDIGYKYVKQFLIVHLFSVLLIFFCNRMHDPISNADLPIVLK